MLIDSIQEFGDALLGDKKKVGSSGESGSAAGDIAGRDGVDNLAPSQISTASQIASQISTASQIAPAATGKKNTLISRELALQLFTKAR